MIIRIKMKLIQSYVYRKIYKTEIRNILLISKKIYLTDILLLQFLPEKQILKNTNEKYILAREIVTIYAMRYKCHK